MGFSISLTFLFLCTAFLLKEAVSQCPQSNEPVKINGTKCYEFVIHRRVTRHAAKTYCSRKYGHLVTIENKSAQDFVYNTLVSLGYGGEGVWIGLTDEGHENRYTWDSGSTSTFTYWAPGQPGILHSLEDCVLLNMQDHGKWHDYRCSDLLFIIEHDAFVCEYDMKSVSTGMPITFMSTTASPSTASPPAASPSRTLTTIILTDAFIATDTLPPTTTPPEVLIGKQ